jgi:hypothetical protein
MGITCSVTKILRRKVFIRRLGENGKEGMKTLSPEQSKERRGII